MIDSFLFVVWVLRNTCLLRYDAAYVPNSLVLVDGFPSVDLKLYVASFVFGVYARHYEHVLYQKVNGVPLLLVEVLYVVQELNLSVQIQAALLVLLFVRVGNQVLGQASLGPRIRVDL